MSHPWEDRPRSHRALDAWLAGRIMAGWHPRAIVAACDGAMSERTAYRWRKRLTGTAIVRVGDHVALFAILRDAPPIRLGQWEPVSAAGMIEPSDGEETSHVA